MICAIPSPIAAAVMIEVKGVGHKYTGTTTALLGFECIVMGILQFAMLAIITSVPGYHARYGTCAVWDLLWSLGLESYISNFMRLILVNRS